VRGRLDWATLGLAALAGLSAAGCFARRDRGAEPVGLLKPEKLSAAEHLERSREHERMGDVHAEDALAADIGEEAGTPRREPARQRARAEMELAHVEYSGGVLAAEGALRTSALRGRRRESDRERLRAISDHCYRKMREARLWLEREGIPPERREKLLERERVTDGFLARGRSSRRR